MGKTPALQVVDGAPPGVALRGTGTGPAGTTLALPGGVVACNFRIVRERRRSSTCELLVANDTPKTITTVAYPQGPLEPGQIAPSGALRIPPFSAIAVTLDFPKTRHGARRILAALHAGDAHLELEANALRSTGNAWAWRGAAGFIGLCAVVFALTLPARERPHVGPIVSPATLTAGRPFDIVYAFSQARQGRYALTAADGSVVASGPLAAGGGVLPLDVPAAPSAAGYDLRIVAENAFGNDARVAHLVALATPVTARKIRPVAKKRTTAPLDVANLTLEHAEVAGGQPIGITYATKAAAGTVRLIDELGTVRAEALLNAQGHSILIAPFVHDAQDFRVVVTAQRGATRAEAATGVRILDAPPVGAGTGGRGWSDAGPISVATTVAPNASVPVLILRHEHDLRVALVGDDGKEVDAVDVSPEDTRVSLWMPPHTTGRQFSVVVSFVHGSSAETRIVPLSVSGAVKNDAG